VLAILVSSELIVKLQLYAARILAKMEVHVPIQPISAVTPVLVPQLSLGSTVEFLFHAPPVRVKTAVLARIQPISALTPVLALQV